MNQQHKVRDHLAIAIDQNEALANRIAYRKNIDPDEVTQALIMISVNSSIAQALELRRLNDLLQRMAEEVNNGGK